jgi:hypothetical protein
VTIFIKTLNKFRITTKNTKDIEFINSNCNRQPPTDFTIPYLFYTNKLVQKHNENVLIRSHIYFQSNGHQQSIMPTVLQTFKRFE